MGKILVVDDEAEVREVVCDILTAYRHDVLLADGVHNALEILAVEQPQVDVLISDVRMPHNGVVLIEEVARLYPSVAIVMMTGYSLENLAAWPLLHKPFRLAALMAAVEVALHDKIDPQTEPAPDPVACPAGRRG